MAVETIPATTNMVSNFYVRQKDGDYTQSKIQLDASQVMIQIKDGKISLQEYIDNNLDRLWQWVSNSELYHGGQLDSNDLTFLNKLITLITLIGSGSIIDRVLINKTSLAENTQYTEDSQLVQESIDTFKERLNKSSTEIKDYNNISYKKFKSNDTVLYAIDDKYHMVVDEGANPAFMIRTLKENIGQTSNSPVIDLNGAFVENGLFK